MEEYIKAICIYGLGECPYHKSHCCLCEVELNSISADEAINIRHKCKIKGSRKVQAILQRNK